MPSYYDTRKKVELIFVGVLVMTAILYGIFRAYPLIHGPTITLYNPQDGDTVASSTFEVSGKVDHAKKITLQGKPITIDTEGRFKETLVSLTPYTILVVQATDSYGVTVTKTLRVIPK